MPYRWLVACLCACAFANPAQLVTPAKAEPQSQRVAQGIYAVTLPERIAGDERIVPARSIFIVGSRGVVVVDTGLAYSDGIAILDAIRRVTSAPVRLAVLTHPSQEAIFGAAAFQDRGIPVAMQPDAARLMAARCADCLAHLTRALGEAAMGRTRVVQPDRLLADGEIIRDNGRALRVIAPPHSSAPGAIAIYDAKTSTLIAGSLVAVRSVPDLRDAEMKSWPAALQQVGATRCRHLVPAHGAIGSCRDIEAFARYLRDLDAHVAALLAQGVTLGELDSKSGLSAYAAWDRYAMLHRANASRTYLRLESAALESR